MKVTSTAPDWVADAIFYEIFPDRFANGDRENDSAGVVPWNTEPTRESLHGGDLRGILERLPYLEDLGISALYLTPVFEGRTNHKYDTSDYFRVDPAFGDQVLLKRLVTEAHNRGIRIILDGVFNHCGDGFWAFQDVLERGLDSDYASWFFLNGSTISQVPPSYQTCGGTSYLPKLNTSKAEVRDHLLRAAVYWIETCDIDGWRLDVPWKVPMDFWREFRDKVKSAKSDAYILAEVWRDPRPWLDGDTVDGVMNYQLRNQILDYFVTDDMDAEDFDYELGRQRDILGLFGPSQMNLLGSHDTARILTLCEGNTDRLKLAMVFLMTYIGAPMVYYGDEVGLEGGDDPNCRRAMPWDEQVWNLEVRNVLSTLIRARREHPSLTRGGFEPLVVFNGVYIYRRILEEDQVIVVLNSRSARSRIEVPLQDQESPHGHWLDILTGRLFEASSSILNIEGLPCQSAFVLIPESH